jgi:hypothetical protein
MIPTKRAVKKSLLGLPSPEISELGEETFKRGKNDLNSGATTNDLEGVGILTSPRKRVVAGNG